jgi:hypothetical protein
MKLPPLLKRDLATAHQRETAALAAAVDMLATLRTERATILHGEDDLQAVVTVDNSIKGQEAIIGAHRERLHGIEEEQRLERLAQREKEKTIAVGNIEQNFLTLTRSATALEKALAGVGEAFNHYTKARQVVLQPWPAHLLPPLHRNSPFWIEDNVATVIGQALAIERGSAAIRLAEAGPRTAGIAEAAKKHAELFVQMLRDAPLPAEQSTEEAA